MCIRHLGGHNLAKLIRAPSNEMAQPECTRSGDLTRCDTARLTKRCHKGENGKWAARTCTRHPSGHKLEKLIWAPSNKTTRTKHARLGDLTRRDTVYPNKRCHKGSNGKRATRTRTRHPSGHNLAKPIQVPSNETARPEREIGRAHV